MFVGNWILGIIEISRHKTYTKLASYQSDQGTKEFDN